MFGTYFIIAQYMQFVRGYSPLDAGVRMLPWALVYMMSATQFGEVGGALRSASGRQRRARDRAAVGLALMSRSSDIHTQLRVFALSLVVMALGMGIMTAPSTGAIMRVAPVAQGGRRLGGQRHDA